LDGDIEPFVFAVDVEHLLPFNVKLAALLAKDDSIGSCLSNSFWFKLARFSIILLLDGLLLASANAHALVG